MRIPVSKKIADQKKAIAANAKAVEVQDGKGFMDLKLGKVCVNWGHQVHTICTTMCMINSILLCMRVCLAGCACVYAWHGVCMRVLLVGCVSVYGWQAV